MNRLQIALDKYQIFLKEYNLKIKNIDSVAYKKNLKFISNINKSITKKIKSENYKSQNSSTEFKLKDVDYFVNTQIQVKEKTYFLLKKILESNKYDKAILKDSNLFFCCLSSLCFFNIISNSQDLDIVDYMAKLFI